MVILYLVLHYYDGLCPFCSFSSIAVLKYLQNHSTSSTRFSQVCPSGLNDFTVSSQQRSKRRESWLLGLHSSITPFLNKCSSPLWESFTTNNVQKLNLTLQKKKSRFFFYYYFKKCINVHRCPNMGQGSTSVKCQGLVVAISCSSTLEMLNTRKNSAS